MAQLHEIRRWSALVATAITLAGCGGDRAGGAGDVGRTDNPESPADTVAAVPADTTGALPGGPESTTSTDAPRPGTTVVRPTPNASDSDTAAAKPSSQASRSDTTARTARPNAGNRQTATAPRRPSDSAGAKPPAPPRTDTAAASAAPADSGAPGAMTDQRAQANAAEQGQPSPQPTSPSPAGGAPLRDEYHRAPRDTVSQVTYEGWKQYNLNCARCHGEDVMGTTIAPHLIVSLKPNGPINTQQAFTQVVCAGRKERGMPAWCELGLEMDTIQAIYAYVKGRSEGKIGPGRPAVRQSS